ncbi:MAG: hypothetical protein AB7P04_12525 [Bacteriovoracia bacterium]
MKLSSMHSLVALVVSFSGVGVAAAAPTPTESPTLNKAAAPLSTGGIAKAQIKQIIRPVVNCNVNVGQVYSYDNGLEDSGRVFPLDLSIPKHLKEKTKNVLTTQHLENDVAVQVEVTLDHPEIKNVLGKSVTDQLTGIGNIVIRRRNPQNDKYEDKAKITNRISNETLLHLDASVGPATNGEYRKATVSCYLSPSERTVTPSDE